MVLQDRSPKVNWPLFSAFCEEEGNPDGFFLESQAEDDELKVRYVTNDMEHFVFIGRSQEHDSTSTAGKLNRDPCQFLSNDKTCSIYSSRPLNCRTFHTLDDPKYCKNKTDKHQVYGSADRGYGVTFYFELARWLYELHSSRNLPYRDIRD